MDERIKELAFKAGFSLTAYEGLWEAEIADIERFAKLVRQDEREACAKLCDERGDACGDDYEAGSAYACAEEIRGRGNT